MKKKFIAMMLFMPVVLAGLSSCNGDTNKESADTQVSEQEKQKTVYCLVGYNVGTFDSLEELKSYAEANLMTTTRTDMGDYIEVRQVSDLDYHVMDPFEDSEFIRIDVQLEERVWTYKEYKVTYHTSSGTEVAYIQEDHTPDKSMPDYEEDGVKYSFAGWSLTEGGSVVKIISSSCDLYPVYVEGVSYVTVTIHTDKDDDTKVRTVTAERRSTITLPVLSDYYDSEYCYIWKGYKTLDGTIYENTPLLTDMELYPYYEATKPTVTLTVSVEDGILYEGEKTISFTYGDEIAYPSVTDLLCTGVEWEYDEDSFKEGGFIKDTEIKAVHNRARREESFSLTDSAVLIRSTVLGGNLEYEVYDNGTEVSASVYYQNSNAVYIFYDGALYEFSGDTVTKINVLETCEEVEETVYKDKDTGTKTSVSESYVTGYKVVYNGTECYFLTENCHFVAASSYEEAKGDNTVYYNGIYYTYTDVSDTIPENLKAKAGSDMVWYKFNVDESVHKKIGYYFVLREAYLTDSAGTEYYLAMTKEYDEYEDNAVLYALNSDKEKEECHWKGESLLNLGTRVDEDYYTISSDNVIYPSTENGSHRLTGDYSYYHSDGELVRIYEDGLMYYDDSEFVGTFTYTTEEKNDCIYYTCVSMDSNMVLSFHLVPNASGGYSFHNDQYQTLEHASSEYRVYKHGIEKYTGDTEGTLTKIDHVNDLYYFYDAADSAYYLIYAKGTPQFMSYTKNTVFTVDGEEYIITDNGLQEYLLTASKDDVCFYPSSVFWHTDDYMLYLNDGIYEFYIKEDGIYKYSDTAYEDYFSHKDYNLNGNIYTVFSADMLTQLDIIEVNGSLNIISELITYSSGVHSFRCCDNTYFYYGDMFMTTGSWYYYTEPTSFSAYKGDDFLLAEVYIGSELEAVYDLKNGEVTSAMSWVSEDDTYVYDYDADIAFSKLTGEKLILPSYEYTFDAYRILRNDETLLVIYDGCRFAMKKNGTDTYGYAIKLADNEYCGFLYEEDGKYYVMKLELSSDSFTVLDTHEITEATYNSYNRIR